jgi:hypothetical protein
MLTAGRRVAIAAASRNREPSKSLAEREEVRGGEEVRDIVPRPRPLHPSVELRLIGLSLEIDALQILVSDEAVGNLLRGWYSRDARVSRPQPRDQPTNQ